MTLWLTLLLLSASPAPVSAAPEFPPAYWRALPWRPTLYWNDARGWRLCDDPACPYCPWFVWKGGNP